MKTNLRISLYILSCFSNIYLSAIFANMVPLFRLFIFLNLVLHSIMDGSGCFWFRIIALKVLAVIHMGEQFILTKRKKKTNDYSWTTS